LLLTLDFARAQGIAARLCPIFPIFPMAMRHRDGRL
jgi:hypothetical protein